jgi:hypothetical protein
MTSSCCDKVYHRFFEAYEKEKVLVWEIGCLECPPKNCACSREEITGIKVPNSVKISGDFKQIAILNIDYDTNSPMWAGKYSFLKSLVHVHKGINIYCTCSLRALSKINFLTDGNVYLTAAEKHKVIKAGSCKLTKTAFLIHSRTGKVPSLTAWSQITLIKAFHSYSSLRYLAKAGFFPEKLLNNFPPLRHVAAGLTHISRKGRHTVQFSTCSESRMIKIRFYKMIV